MGTSAVFSTEEESAGTQLKGSTGQEQKANKSLRGSEPVRDNPSVGEGER